MTGSAFIHLFLASLPLLLLCPFLLFSSSHFPIGYAGLRLQLHADFVHSQVCSSSNCNSSNNFSNDKSAASFQFTGHTLGQLLVDFHAKLYMSNTRLPLDGMTQML